MLRGRSMERREFKKITRLGEGHAFLVLMR
jgi:hypothetical protein